jgi:predicted 2-oxoglutarate/Fe(II)-dependent dioxygenase YbiX
VAERPGSYEGGELAIYLGTKPVVIKGEAGSLVVYPSTQLHEVTPCAGASGWSPSPSSRA